MKLTPFSPPPLLHLPLPLSLCYFTTTTAMLSFFPLSPLASPPLCPPFFFLIPFFSSLISCLLSASLLPFLPTPLPPPVGPHIGRYCGQTSPGRVISYTGILSMTITTDNAIAREGFSANYTIRERSLPPGHEDEGEQLD